MVSLATTKSIVTSAKSSTSITKNSISGTLGSTTKSTKKVKTFSTPNSSSVPHKTGALLSTSLAPGRALNHVCSLYLFRLSFSPFFFSFSY